MKMKLKRHSNTVNCEVNGCGRPFIFINPEQQLVVLDVHYLPSNEVKREYCFMCDECYIKFHDLMEGDQWQED